MIKNIIFDNGGVIVKYHPDTYLDYFNYDKNVQNDLNTLFTTQAWVDLSKGLISKEKFLDACHKIFPHYRDEINKVFARETLMFLSPVYAQTIDFIKDLRTKGYKIYLLSDINEDLIWALNDYVKDFESLFDGIVYSCRVGMVKKEGIVFDYILDKYHLDPKETLFLDDTIINLQEAMKRNVITYRFTNPDVDIDRIKEMLNIYDKNKYENYSNKESENTARSFHKNRIAFMIIDDDIKILKESGMSHYEWANSLGINEDKFNTLVRGYYMDDRIIFYKGNFTYDNSVIEVSKIYAPKLKEILNIHHKCNIYCGLIVGVGSIWPPDYFVEEL